MERNEEYKLRKQFDRIRRGIDTDFLDMGQFKDITRMLSKNEYQVYYPYEDADKIILYVYEIPKVEVLKINSYHELKHNEILGSLFGLNIDSSLFGDIIIDNDNYYILVIPKIKRFILDNLFMIGNKYVELEEVSLDVIINYKRKYEVREVIVSSLRIDNVIAKIIGTSRGIIKEKIQNKEVILNYSILKNSSYNLRENDIFSIRRYGKYRFSNIIKTTKKDNYIIKFYKYI